MDQASLLMTMEQDLPPLPRVALQTMKLVEDQNSSASDLVELISQDQALASRILRLANSAFYGVRATVDTLSKAIVTQGWGQVQSLVLVAACQSQHRSTTFSDQALWDHALAVSQVARKVALKCRYPKVDEASTAGLMHDIGKVVMDRHLGEEYKQVVDLVHNEGLNFIAAEHKVIGVTHPEVGGIVIRKWNLPPSLAETVILHHNPESAKVDTTLCAIVSLANSICVKQGIGLESFPDMDLQTLNFTSMLSLDEEQVSDLLDETLFQAA